MSFGMFPVVGKRGKRRSYQLREQTANNHGAQTGFRTNVIPSQVEESRYKILGDARLVTMILSLIFLAFCSARNVGSELR
jgi:hypothetical protein